MTLPYHDEWPDDWPPTAVKLIEELADALRNLYDQQNGPPLIRHEKKWQAAMDQAKKMLTQVGG